MADRPQLSEAEVKAQREAKKAAKAAKVAAAVAKGSDSAPTSHNDVAPQKDLDVATIVTDRQNETALVPASDTHHQDVTTKPAMMKPAAAKAAVARDNVPKMEVDAAISLENPAKPLPLLPPCDIAYSVASLGLAWRSLRLVGANARTLGLLNALLDVVKTDTTVATMTSLNAQNAEVLFEIVKRNTDFLGSCRALTAGMEFVLKTFRERLLKTAQRTDIGKSPKDVADRHLSDIASEVATAIADVVNAAAQSCVNNGDVILTYGRSAAIEQTLIAAGATGIDFTVMIVDAAPLFEGRGLQWRLQQRGIKTSYVLLSAVCAHMARCTRVFIGAVSVLQNGQVVGRAGTAVVSLVAKQFRRPLLCFCETYKFTERIWRNVDQGSGITARYDTTPKDTVDMIVSDIGFLHPTAIAAAIRDRDERECRASDPF